MITLKGQFAIAGEEGLVPAPYIDAVGRWTYGVGHTADAGQPDPAKMVRGMPKDLDAAVADAFALFGVDLIKYESRVKLMLGHLELHELAGWSSFDYNTGGITRTSAVEKWRAGDKTGAMDILEQWNKGTVNGRKQVIPALVKRREAESAMILRGEYPNRPVNVWAANAQGRIDWSRPIRSLSFADVQRLSGRSGAVVGTKTGAGLAAAIAAALGALALFWDKLFG